VTGLFSAEHLGALAAIAACTAVFVSAARTKPGIWIKALAAVLVADEVSWWIFLVVGGEPGSQLAQSLPLQLCDLGIFVAAFALWFRIPWLVELTYFWGLAGSFQALLTPDLPQHFPTYPYFQYYLAHGGVVAAALLLVIGLGQYPRPRALLRVAGLSLAYATLIGFVDALTGANYMYLRSKPPSPTLLDILGPWPWYILSATAVGVLLFVVLDAPFRLRRRPIIEKTATQ
jgi:hypothetical integral membrane protein (TIGR02206 family)